MSVKILTVDDSKTIRLIVAKAFKPYDCNVLEAPNGVVGLATASKEHPDLILLDYTMPVMDGFEVLGRLRADPELKSTPVIMLTAEAGRDTVIKIARLGVRDYLIKPFKEELLLERVGRVVSLKLKSDEVVRHKRFDDPIRVLVLDDKPAIVEQIRAGLADTPWHVNGTDQPAQALEACTKQTADIVLVSLSLPKDGAYLFLQSLRALTAASSIPVFGLCVKTAAAEQLRAQQAGFTGVVTKPIDKEELKSKISRSLKLETSYKYFQEREGAMLITIPKEVDQTVTTEVSKRLSDQLTAIVDAGGDKVVVDLTQVEKATTGVIELVLSAIQAGTELSLRYAVIGSEAIRRECRSFEETQSWAFAQNFDEALTLLK